MIKITREELKMIVEAADRKGRRTGQRFVIDWSRVKVLDKQEDRRAALPKKLG